MSSHFPASLLPPSPPTVGRTGTAPSRGVPQQTGRKSGFWRGVPQCALKAGDGRRASTSSGDGKRAKVSRTSATPSKRGWRRQHRVPEFEEAIRDRPVARLSGSVSVTCMADSVNGRHESSFYTDPFWKSRFSDGSGWQGLTSLETAAHLAVPPAASTTQQDPVLSQRQSSLQGKQGPLFSNWSQFRQKTTPTQASL